jgi:hypothetical protein
MKNAVTAPLSLMIFVLAGLVACSNDSGSENPSPGFSLENFSRHWIHSVEEQESLDSSEHIYRPEGFKEFPPSMYRKQYVFGRNGSMQYLWPHPADAHEMRTGSWRLDAQRGDVIHTQEGDQALTYQVLEVTPEMLRLRLIEE